MAAVAIRILRIFQFSLVASVIFRRNAASFSQPSPAEPDD